MGKHELHPQNWVDLYADYLFNYAVARVSDVEIADPFTRDGDNILENEELGLALQECLDKLPKKQAQVFKMKTIQGMETEDICNELDINPSNLWVMIHRARTSLMGCMNENWF